VLGQDTALMLGIASKSGDMKAIFESVARFVERQADFKKGLLSSMILPAVTVLALIGALAFYILYLLPKMVDLLTPVSGTMPPLTTFTLEVSDMLKDNFWPLVAFTAACVSGFYAWLMTANGRVMFDRIVMKVPYIGRILRNTSVELFCRVLGIMYTTGENIDAIQHAAEASRNRFLEKQIKNVSIPTMLKYGTEFWKSLEMTKVFPEMVVSRFRTASETGSVKATAIQLADYYEMENRYAMKNLVNVIEVGVSLVIMVSMVFLTLLSSETATVNIKPHQNQQQTIGVQPDSIVIAPKE
jgi:type IV pilus assembly protein PilC